MHSLHAYFLRPGDPKVPILYEVDRIRDGRSFTTRRVVAIQHGQAIFNLQASFHAPEPGLDHQRAMPRTCPTRSRCPTSRRGWSRTRTRSASWYDRPRPIDVRYVDGRPDSSRKGATPDGQRVWLRADGELPDDPVLHACVVTYASDMTLLDTDRAAVRAGVGHARRADGQPRPRDVVPPAVPRRRVAAVRPARRLDAVGARPRRRLDLHRATAGSW